MSLLLYGICRAEQTELVELSSALVGSSLSPVEAGGLAAIATRGAKLQGGLEGALAFAEVVEALHRAAPILPLRYPSRTDRPEKVQAYLRDERERLRSALDTVEGCDEVGLRLLLPASAAPVAGHGGRAPGEALAGEGGAAAGGRATAERGATAAAGEWKPTGPGAAHLQALRRRHEAREHGELEARRRAERVQASFAGLYRRGSFRQLRQGSVDVLSLSFLVEREQLAAFQARFRRCRGELGAPAVCTGPWPPYVSSAELVMPAGAALTGLDFLQRSKG